MDMENETINNDTVSLELIQMQNETIWLIQRDIPVVCKRVKRIIQRCIELLQPTSYRKDKGDGSNGIHSDADYKDSRNNNNNNNNNNSNNNNNNREEDQKDFDYLDDLLDDDKNDGQEKKPDANVIQTVAQKKAQAEKEKFDINTNKFESEHGSRGIVTLDGWFLDAQEIIIKFLKVNKASPIYKTSIQKNKPWRIQQIQNVYNHLCFILSEIDNIINFSLNYKPILPNSLAVNSNSCSNNNNNEIVSPPGNKQIIQLPEIYALVENIRSISESLAMAKDELLLPSKSVFPSTLYQPNVLQPHLPFEINVDITVSNCEIVLSFHELSIISESTSSGLNSPGKQLSKSSGSIRSSSGSLNGSSNGIAPISPLSTSLSSHRQKSEELGAMSTPQSSIPQSHSSNSLHQMLVQQQQLQQQQQQQRNTYSGFTTNSILHGIPTSSVLLSPTESEQTHSTPDYIKRPFQTSKSGSNQLITVTDHIEARVSFKKLSDSFSLLSNAYDKLAELGEKFLVLSNIN
ncbi:hypothetical protein DLAC_01211 [Tieghemostelium lacteum]|uniref:Uncharacterized protein n=1 Tax=Tieghemostelium lacteum TaxID=361077 RepID=A0A152A812_TIELA|nr:hypothetical protein DLAC_01211 [Tieghemostelium lacteum]|eukprot:KYR02373.1 hypothetical protein DLAC_01211 [Tieghemostelium lacteum]